MNRFKTYGLILGLLVSSICVAQNPVMRGELAPGSYVNVAVDALGQMKTVAGSGASATNVISTVNSTTTNLAPAAVFTGTCEDITLYGEIRTSLFSSHASATDGLQMQQSQDCVNWDASDSYTIPAATNKAFGTGAAARYFRIVYTNGGTLTTSLRIQTTFHTIPSKPSSVRPQDARSNENDFEETSAYLSVFNGTTWDRLRGSTTGVQVIGPVAHSTAVAGAPVRVAGKVATAVDTSLINGDTSDVLMTSGGAQIVHMYSAPEISWQYAAAASGIVNTTTAVTMKTAAAAGVRNYITSIQVMAEALGAATELAIRDGAAGTVIWRTKIPITGLLNGISITFPVPLRGTAATLLEVVTLSASVTGAVYFNAQGFTAP